MVSGLGCGKQGGVTALYCSADQQLCNRAADAIEVYKHTLRGAGAGTSIKLLVVSTYLQARVFSSVQRWMVSRAPPFDFRIALKYKGARSRTSVQQAVHCGARHGAPIHGD
jgi:hypothetical protein